MTISWPKLMAISLTPGLLQAMWDRGSQVSQVAMTVCGAASWKLGQLMIRTKHVAGKNGAPGDLVIGEFDDLSREESHQVKHQDQKRGDAREVTRFHIISWTLIWLKHDLNGCQKSQCGHNLITDGVLIVVWP